MRWPGRRTAGVMILAVIPLWGGCAFLTAPPPGGVSPGLRAQRAQVALEGEAFDDAREHLVALASDCASGAHGREALLLLAASELDTGNPMGSPRLAAHAAASYLLLADADPERIPLARALYRLGTDLSPPESQAFLPSFASRFDDCNPAVATTSASTPVLPSTPTRWGSRLSVLQAHLSARSASLADARDQLEARSEDIARLRAESAALERQIATLQAEIDRIMELLKSGMPGHTPHGLR